MGASNYEGILIHLDATCKTAHTEHIHITHLIVLNCKMHEQWQWYSQLLHHCVPFHSGSQPASPICEMNKLWMRAYEEYLDYSMSLHLWSHHTYIICMSTILKSVDVLNPNFAMFHYYTMENHHLFAWHSAKGRHNSRTHTTTRKIIAEHFWCELEIMACMASLLVSVAPFATRRRHDCVQSTSSSDSIPSAWRWSCNLKRAHCRMWACVPPGRSKK